MSDQNRNLKFAYGEKENIESALELGTIDEWDLIVTSDTHEMYIVSPEGVVYKIGARTDRYTSVEEAVEAINESEDTYAGQQIVIMDDDGNYNVYVVQNGTEDDYIVEPISTDASSLQWHEF